MKYYIHLDLLIASVVLSGCFFILVQDLWKFLCISKIIKRIANWFRRNFFRYKAKQRERELIKIGLDLFQKSLTRNKVPIGYLNKFGPLNERQIIDLDDEIFRLTQRFK